MYQPAVVPFVPARMMTLPSPLRVLRSRLRSSSTTPELLFDLMGFGPFAEMAMTKDGQLIARPRRSLGFDAFVGRPSPNVLARTARLFEELDPDQRQMVLARLMFLGIDPTRVGIPVLQEVGHGR